MEINIDEYLTHDEKKEIVISEYRKAIHSSIATEADVQRVLSNAGYNTVYKIVDECFDVDSKAIIKAKIDEVLADVGAYHIFQKPDAWSRETNSAYDYMQKCIADSEGVIREKIESLLDEQIIVACKQDIKDVVAEAISDHVASY